jgi:hypothetical protein
MRRTLWVALIVAAFAGPAAAGRGGAGRPVRDVKVAGADGLATVHVPAGHQLGSVGRARFGVARVRPVTGGVAPTHHGVDVHVPEGTYRLSRTGLGVHRSREVWVMRGFDLGPASAPPAAPREVPRRVVP